jgi:hypothetical protein
MKAFPVSLIVRPLLTSGILAVKKDNTGVLILIDSEQPDKQKTIALWHEFIHLIQLASGVELKDIDEGMTEMLAARFADRCPEILALCTPPLAAHDRPSVATSQPDANTSGKSLVRTTEVAISSAAQSGVLLKRKVARPAEKAG